MTWRTLWLAGWLVVVVGVAHVVWRERWWHRCRERAARLARRVYPWLDRAGHGPALLLFSGLMLILGGLLSEVWWATVSLGVGAALVVGSVEKREERRAAQINARFDALARQVQSSEITVREDVMKATAFLTTAVHDATDEILDNHG